MKTNEIFKCPAVNPADLEKFANEINKFGCTSFNLMSFTPEEINIIKENISMSKTDKNEATYDNVNKPKHYNREGGMQCIEEMELIFGKESVKTFCKLNAWKYRYRAADKNGYEDLQKSDWYLNKYKELCEGGTTVKSAKSTNPYQE